MTITQVSSRTSRPSLPLVGIVAALPVLHGVLLQSASADLVSRWRFNDPTETTFVSEVHTGGNNLEILGSPTYVNTPGTLGGYQNRGLFINNDPSDTDGLRKIQPGGSWNLDLTNGFSLVAWVQIFDVYNSSESRIMGLTGCGINFTYYKGNNGIWGYLNNSDCSVGVNLTGGVPIRPMSDITQLAYTWDGTSNPGSLNLYTNGVLVATATSPLSSLDGSALGDFLVGFDPPYRLSAVLDELHVYNTALSGAQLAALSPEIVPEPGVVALAGAGLLLLSRRVRRR